MGLSLVTGPALEPVSLAEARAQCRVDSNEDDGLLQGYVLAARALVEHHTRRALLTQTHALTIDSAWPTLSDGKTQQIVLSKPPVQSISSITYIDSSGTAATLDPSQYTLAKLSTGEWVVTPVFGITWPTLQAQLAAATVTFVSGSSSPGSIPEPLRQAILLLTSHWYDQRAVEVARISQELPFGVSALLAAYRVYY